MYEIRINDRIAMSWNKLLPDGNYDYDDLIAILQVHKEELGIDLSDQDIAEIINVEGISHINYYMTKGKIDSHYKYYMTKENLIGSHCNIWYKN